jgi:outer membrane protein OmpA-like peptidoglycan-associated protein
MKKLFALILVTFLAGNIFAQNVEFTKDNFKGQKDQLKDALNAIKGGDQYFEQGEQQYERAIPYYLHANEFNPNNAMLNYKIGLCYIHSAFKWNAQDFLKKAYKLDPNVSPDIHYYLGRANHLSEDWDGAVSEYNMYLQGLNPSKQADKIKDTKKKIQECKDGMDLVKTPVRVFIDNVGSAINGKYPDYGPVISADESIMYFTSRRENSTGGKTEPGTPDYYEDIYVSTNLNGKWTPCVNAGPPINTEGHDADLSISADGSHLFMYADNGKDHGDIFECDQKGLMWGKPERLNHNINTSYHENSCSVTPDGKTLYFVSDKPDESFGGHDIYMSKLDDKGRWGKAVNLGGVINTEYDELSVFIHPDGKTLYFSSKGHKTMGGFDIFKSVYNEKTNTWSTPENIGYPVNSPDDDIDFVLSASGKHGYYSSFKKDGMGEKDIYMITFLGAEKPPVMSTEDNLLASLSAPVKETVILNKVDINAPQLTILKGMIFDELSKKPLEANIDLIDNSKNEVIATFKSNSSTGRYLVSLPCGKNYGIAVRVDNYLFHSENFDIPLTNGYQEVVKDIPMKNISVGSKIILKNIFFDFDKSTLRQPESTNELDRLIKLLNDVPTMKIEISGHTDSKGSDSYNLTLSQNRAQAVVDYLAAHGIDKGRLKATGYGETKPIDTNDTDEGRQNNRRTEFEILSK